SSLQTALTDVFNKTHNIKQDDLAIRSENIQELRNKYENYRRNFPIYREWKKHIFFKTSNIKLNNLLNSLGFTMK
ncbi:MAG TPA: DUF3410 domain-containing protein, partial [Thiomicrospira sp.]|nr:DUF3410 domain-containing protein [Thiomicrospira sp.]